MTSDEADGTAPRTTASPAAPHGPPRPRGGALVHLPAPSRQQVRSAAAVALHWAGVLLVVVVGAAVGAALAPATPATVGPLQLDVRVVPSLSPGVQLLLPPAGRVDFDTHLAPVSVRASVTEVDVEGAKDLLSDPRGLAGLQAAAPAALRTATVRAALTTGTAALLGAGGLSLLVYRRRWRRTGQVAAGLVGVLVATGVTAVTTFDPDRLAQPHFTGLLSRAPYVTSRANGLIDRLESYRSGLADIVQGVTALYATSGDLPGVADTGDDVVRVLHVSDIHLNPLAFDLIDRLVAQFGIDVVVDTGDITTWGTEVEGTTLRRIRGVGAPYVFVRGNHDSRRTQSAVRANRNAIVLDDDVVRVEGLVIAGIGDPEFTPDAAAEPLGAVTTRPTTRTGAGSTLPTVPTLVPATPPSSPRSSLPPSLRTTGAPTGSAAPTATVTAGEAQPSTDPQVRAGERLAGTVRTWNAAHPDDPVDIAMVHEPRSTGPLLGVAPLVLAGHLHKRSVEVDEATGTRVMVEGSTGGAGITAGTVGRLTEGKPVPLSATIVYIARSGPRARQVVAYDEVTVGGFGLASVSLQRTVVRAADAPTPSPSPAPSGPTSAPASLPAAGPDDRAGGRFTRLG